MAVKLTPSTAKRWWLKCLRLPLGWLVRIRFGANGKPHASLLEGTDRLVYALESDGLFNLLVLSLVCRAADLPDPLLSQEKSDPLRVRFFSVQGKSQKLLSGTRARPTPPRLVHLMEQVDAHEDLRVRIVPVSILLGRSPNKPGGALNALFFENWVIAGRVRRFFAVLINGRNTLVHFGEPVEARAPLDELGEVPRAVRRIARVARKQFRGYRSAVIGPDLSHRRTMVDDLLKADSVQKIINERVKREPGKRAAEKARKKARKYANEIAADYSYPVIQFLERLLNKVWNRIYDGIRINHFEPVRELARDHEIVYVPCHRSHIDYLVLSYVLYHQGLVPPHIAAGVNLNLPVVGPILRRAGAFFMRRSFRNNPLYSAVFYEYFSNLLTKGVAIEYFIEGGRSRTGRLLQARPGMLTMTVRSYLKDATRPVVFIPVYFGYEKLPEGKSYTGELSGGQKRKESLFGLARSLKVLKEHFGQVHVNFGQPLPLAEVLERHHPGWRDTGFQEASGKPPWMAPMIDDLGKSILARINAAADVNPVNLLALALLSSPRRAMGEDLLASHLELLRELLTKAPYSERVTVTPMSGQEMIAHGLKLGVLQRQSHELGDIIAIDEHHSVLLSYFRNNALHLFALPAWIACTLQHTISMPVKQILRLGAGVYPYLQSELYLHFSPRQLVRRLRKQLQVMESLKLLTITEDGKNVARPPGGTLKAMQLGMIGQSVQKTFERYYITISVLARHGSGRLSSAALERLCHLYAQRLSLLQEFNAPEFFDQRLFRQFIQELVRNKVLQRDGNGLLEFGQNLHDIAQDAKLILSKQVRHGILQVTEAARPRVENDRQD
jgi:glycerol-3-phosphate O-acyltransferase